MIIPSKYQAAIFEWIKNGSGHGIVSATAGSGKTTTLVEASKLLQTPDSIFLAFNAHIASELKTRLGNRMEARTIHSLGLEALKLAYPEIGRKQPQKSKYKDICKSLVDRFQQQNPSVEGADELFDPLQSIVRFAMLTLCELGSPEEFKHLTRSYQVEYPPQFAETLRDLARQVMRFGERYVDEQGVYSFDDMVWLPAKHQLRPRQQYRWIFVDEAQDLNKAQVEVALGALAPGGRMLVVGDRMQAIYGFAGADHRSMDNLKERLQATEMPLSICYRCPTSHIQLAKQLDPTIEPSPNAATGILGAVPENMPLSRMVRDEDLVLCRMTAPLVENIFELIRAGIPARIRGADIGKGLVSMAERAWEKARNPYWSISQFYQALNNYEDSQIQLIDRRRIPEDEKDELIEELSDKIDVLKIIASQREHLSLQDYTRYIESLFSDSRAGVVLSTVHKAKGLEANRVFILKPGLMPHPKAKTTTAMQAEQCIEFVALTRSKHTLVFVGVSNRLPIPMPVVELVNGELRSTGQPSLWA
ncbi:UvrD-helicase domain-containing protein [Deinococcus misasensis]|uniref:UvrD-helicase domain-containing protein n=1 Tax=Deinococcus misasensis TaxID=392413 RepID=UPI00054E490A|nr:ATP-dependent helicase [Deinococcus misasensis]